VKAPFAFMAVSLLMAQSDAPPPMKSVGAKGAAESSGYSAAAAAKSRSELTEVLSDTQRCQPTTPDFDSGLKALSEGDPEKALRIFSDALRSNPANEALTLGQAVSDHEKGEVTQSVALLLQFAADHATLPSPYLLLSEIITLPGYVATEEVQQKLGKLAAMQNAPASAHLAYACSLGPGPAMAKELRQALIQEPNLAAAHRLLGSLESDQGNYKEAIQQYRQALALKPNWTELHYRLAQAYVRTGEKALAYQEFAEHRQAKSAPPTLLPCPK
jgi:tetratricopeptide (TPR) repeat protein